MKPATIDFETRSACNLRQQGAWKYSLDPSTQILCLAYRLPDWPLADIEVWHPAFPAIPIAERIDSQLPALLQWIEDGHPLEAHNVWFEYCIWTNILVPRYGAPLPALTQWRCSAAKAATQALPRGLDDAVAALHLSDRKDATGHKVMLKMSKPRRSRKAEREQWASNGVKPPKYLWWETRGLFDQLVAYCQQDVRVEHALSETIPDISPQELRVFHLDLQTNALGFQLDATAVRTALDLIRRETNILNKELYILTDHQVKRATQRTQMLQWFQGQGLDLDNTQKETLDNLLAYVPKDMQDTPAIRGVQIVRTLGRSSTAKYQAMKNWMTRDGRVRGGLLYHGATTGRWAGKGVQPHNFPKGSQKVDMEALWTTLKGRLRKTITQDYRGVMEALSNGLRGAITATKGSQLYVADYASIEARVLLWLVDDQNALKMFQDGRDIYCEMATDIYHRHITKKDTLERSMGKIAILGLGYQMGASRFRDTCATFHIEITDDFAEQVVQAYRLRFIKVKECWQNQEAAAIDAVEQYDIARGEPVAYGNDLVSWVYEPPFLYCNLPSGRRLAYPYPEIHQKITPWGEERSSLTFMGVDGYSHKWRRQTTYGGMLVENIVQAIARDILAEAMLRLQETQYQMVLTVHDELIAEAPLTYGSVSHFEQIVSECPPWAEGCPIVAEGWRGFRYHK